MKNKTSLKDIANAVGVSITLVSYVLNGKGEKNRVSKNTAKKIIDVAKKLNYYPNLSARSLVTNKTRTIGLIVADIANPFFGSLARFIEDAAFSKDYTVIFCSSDENVNKFDRILNFLTTRQVDGFIIAAPEGSGDFIKKLERLKIPMVLIDRYFKELKTNFVGIDNFQSSLLATNHLINNNCKKIGTILYLSKLDHYGDRYDGYVEALNRAGLMNKIELVKRINYGNLNREMALAIKELISLNVDAIYFHTNILAQEGLKQMIILDKNILHKIKVVAFDQNPAFNFLDTFVPYVLQPVAEMANQALTILCDQIDEGKDFKLFKTCLQTELITKSADQFDI
ncbi:LacI family DNA-binding transcriptional regulator [Flavobacterium weaverense]|uniref:LacI family transcriptional regulator n=1 Tax=Flavobacterium weaverense TaxID=271156 RepID=A0A3L9ZNZ4_9FLAO|nr:LacI family DNA-binding transcriptional regulator [Flavobacterium weaverense]RMA73129.1 LacI family transcriptional regulator [Flavobacterium weaverense]